MVITGSRGQDGKVGARWWHDCAMDALPRHLGRYEIQRTLGKGAMGVVYEALDPRLQRTVAVKTLHRDAQPDEVVRRFLVEARAIARLSHPNIVAIYDIGEEDGMAFIAMELVRGRELASLIDADERPPPLESARIVGQLLQALQYAHERGVLHRDVKPGNVLLTESGDVKLTDFGVARLADGDAERTQAGTIMGTPTYMSPEQVRGEEVGPAADLYAAGVILYQLLTGRRPFVGDSVVALALRIVNEAPPPPSHVNPALPADWDAVVLRALAKQPADRYESATAFWVALAGIRRVTAVRPAPTAAAAGQSAVHGWWQLAMAALARWVNTPSAAEASSPPANPPPPPPPPQPPLAPPPEPCDDRDNRTVLAQPSARAAVARSADHTLLIGPAAASTGAISLLVVRSDVASMVGQRFAIASKTRIGRSDAEIVLPDPLLSRQHALLQQGEQGLTITDLGSANGTNVNGQRLERDRAYPLLPGAQVGLGATVLAVAMDAHDSLSLLAGADLAGRYRLLECLHSSPKGALYRAQRQGSQLVVAVKLLAPGFSQWSGYRESFSAEAEIAAGLQHPHICRLEDHGEGDVVHGGRTLRLPFLIYEMMAGGSLAGRLAALADLSTETLLDWLRDLGSALDHVHRKGLVHGGLKPSAVCFDADGHVYLTDFAHGRTQPGQVGLFGAPAYMAPELWLGHEPHPASDRYALGVLAYRLLASALPYEGQDDPATRERNATRLPPPLHPAAGGRTFGPAATAALTRALAADPAQRFPSAAEFTQQLTRAIANAGRSPTAHTVFISYQRAAATAWVTLIAQELAREHDVRCFVDTTALDRAESFPARIREAIRDCEVFVCILGSETLRSRWVREEIAIAWKYRRTMVPVLLEGFAETPEDLKVRSIKGLLHYGGERILDRQNLFVRESVQRIALRVKSGLSGGA